MTSPTETSPPADDLVVECPRDKGVMTALRCSRCDQPICPKCIIQTPVGGRCRDCARLQKLPTFVVSPMDYLKATAVALPTGLLIGLLWGLIPFAGFFSFIIAFAGGYAIAEVVSRVVNRKYSLWLQVIAAFGIALAVVIQPVIGGIIGSLANPLAIPAVLLAGIVFSVTNFWAWLYIAAGIFGTVVRLRR